MTLVFLTDRALDDLESEAWLAIIGAPVTTDGEDVVVLKPNELCAPPLELDVAIVLLS